MSTRIEESGLQIAKELWQLINEKILPGTGVEQKAFWNSFASLLNDLTPKNKALLAKRDELQNQIDAWHKAQNASANPSHDATAYKAFLTKIGYLLPEGAAFKITTQNVDAEIAYQAGPQLVVPVKNARFALNAVNARWGSLYDALYGTDAIAKSDGAEITATYNPIRGQKVIEFARLHLDLVAPLATGSHKESVAYTVLNGALLVALADGSSTKLLQPEKFVGFNGEPMSPSAVLLTNNNLHVEIKINPKSQIGKTDLQEYKI